MKTLSCLGNLTFQTSIGALCQALPFSPVTFVTSFLSLIWSSLSPLLTHIAGNILDVILTNTSITNDIQFITTLPCGLSSDHYLIHLTLQLDQPSTVPHKVHLSIYDYSKANWDEFLFFLQSQDYTDYLNINSVETLWNILKQLIYRHKYTSNPTLSNKTNAEQNFQLAASDA